MTSAPAGPRPLITEEVDRKQQCRDDLIINADVRNGSIKYGQRGNIIIGTVSQKIVHLQR
jgi:hypothetical protein